MWTYSLVLLRDLRLAKRVCFDVTATDQMHNVNGYVRDFYFFRRNFYPQLSLVHMNPTDAAMALHSQVTAVITPPHWPLDKIWN